MILNKLYIPGLIILTAVCMSYLIPDYNLIFSECKSFFKNYQVTVRHTANTDTIYLERKFN